MKKRTTLCIIILALFLGFSACAKQDVKPDMTVYIVGNTSGNLNNGGHYVEAGRWVYYSFNRPGDYDPNSEDSEHGSFRMKADGSERTRFDNALKNGLNIIGDRIYAFSPILSAKLDGSDIQNVRYMQPFNTDAILVVNDRIIFSDSEKGNVLYIMKSDGTELKQLSTLSSKRIDFAKGWIYYSTLSPVALYKIRFDGSEDTLVSDDIGNDFIIVNDSIYYASIKDGLKLYTMDVMGKNPIKLSNLSVKSLNASKNKLYFIDQSDNRIHSANLDGTAEKSLSQNSAIDISVVTDYIYFTDNSDKPKVYRINLANNSEDIAFKVKHAEPDPIGTPIIPRVSISNMNLNSGGQFARKDDWIYFSTPTLTEKRGLYRIHLDGTGETKLANVPGMNLNIYGNWLYFSNQDALNAICRIPLDGGEIEMVTDTPAQSFLIKDGWIFLAVASLDKGMMKVKPDGTGLEYISHIDGGGNLQLSDEILYYKEWSDGPDMHIKQIGINGTGSKSIGKVVATTMAVDGDWLYYSRRKDGLAEWPSEIHRIKKDGTSDQFLMKYDGYLEVFGVNAGWLYFSNRGNEKGSLMRMKLDGSQKETIIPASVNNVVWEAYIFGDTLITSQGPYFSAQNFYISNLDGSELTALVK